MKANLLRIVGIFIIMIGCSDDDARKIDADLEIESFAAEISALPGQTFIFSGVVSDPTGIASVHLKYEPWFLDKKIIKKSLPKSYELSYKFKVPENAQENSSHTIPVTITNSGGDMVTQDVVVTLNQDAVKPEIQIVAPITGSTVLIGDGVEVDFDITVTDAELAELKIESTLFNETISISGTSYRYTETVEVTDSGTYEFIITVTDVSGNVTTETVTVNFLTTLLFDVMYITDVTDNAALVSDMFGVPYATVASEVADEDGYVFTARYYAPSPNSEVRFLPQKVSFEPYAFGADADIPGKLLLGTDATVHPIVLPETGYYEITMDLRDQSYTVTPYLPLDEGYDQIYIIGTGIFVDDTSTCISNIDESILCWHFQSGKPFTRDLENPYLWSIDVTLNDEPNNEGANGFILNANADGWEPFWRMDDPDDPEAAVFNGGSNYVFPAGALDKDYTFVFDTHLNRISAIRR